MSESTPSVTETLPPTPAKPSVPQILAGFLLPLFFIIGLPLGLVSAFHAPSPHDLALKIVGPQQVVTQITEGLDNTAEFSATQTDVVDEARSSVATRDVAGSIEITPSSTTPTTFTVTTYVANAGGRSAAAAVEGAAASVAEQLGTTSTVVDVAPLSGKDTLGTTLFYLLTYTSLGAYLVIIVLTQVMPKARLRTRLAAVTIASIAAPLLVFGLSSIFVGDYGASFGTIVALLGVDAISVFTVGLVAILVQSLLGKAAIFGVMLTVVFLNFPSAGGAVPAGMLPPFWQTIHNVWFGAGAFESFRSIVYFGGEGLGRWLPQLLAWTFGLLLLILIVELSKTVLRQKKALIEVQPQPVQRRHLKIDNTPTQPSSPTTPHAITAGTETAS